MCNLYCCIEWDELKRMNACLRLDSVARPPGARGRASPVGIGSRANLWIWILVTFCPSPPPVCPSFFKLTVMMLMSHRTAWPPAAREDPVGASCGAQSGGGPMSQCPWLACRWPAVLSLLPPGHGSVHASERATGSQPGGEGGRVPEAPHVSPAGPQHTGELFVSPEEGK